MSLRVYEWQDTYPYCRAMDPVEVGRRVAAARKRAGMKTQNELAAKAAIPRLGPKTIGKIERGQRELYAHEAPLLARALGVPVAYFYEDDTAESQLDRIEQSIRDARTEREQAAQEIRRLLAQQTDLLATIQTLVEGLGVPDGITLQQHLTETVRDAAARSERPERRARS